MLNSIKKFFGIKTVDFKNLVKNGAQIIDVRTVAEYENEHLRNSKNIPLQNLRNSFQQIDKTKPVITICASGIRSGSAKSILQNEGYEAYNGGSWSGLKNKLG
ncbi:rhodanese-like domain-containing protein [Frigoriflavimonas asaccharolytica]|uniref:Rhodanese-related sulfurtransferase n=1 Tax=Frigoriflavimonas asaccharolytica TaxID=2735899 RepID=A0A8J8GBU8_9FLAO|nr:rhodanese-like domain-containing protein [Frigoriflavimonas asaccharolytica]NRS93344.1 rhodanese-related sulfurtransferase [Frigoriflavimonas asaccharolytica]